MAEKMAEKNVGSFKYGALTAIGQKQTEVRFKATLKDGKIEKVLCVNLSPYLTRSECFEVGKNFVDRPRRQSRRVKLYGGF